MQHTFQSGVVLLSGGLDSAVTAWFARTECNTLFTLSFDYGQRHRQELIAANRLAQEINPAAHFPLFLEPTLIPYSALTDRKLPVPKDRLLDGTIPVTYVPGRNIMFLSMAASFAASRGLECVYIGANAVDYSGYPDCRLEFIKAFQEMIDLGLKSNPRVFIRAPLIKLSKADIIRLGISLNVPFHLTSSCYDPQLGAIACGHCDSCLIRLKAFAEVGIKDPIRYADQPL